jgi:exopolyphosphatase/pppGpp-phosphohydrolase
MHTYAIAHVGSYTAALSFFKEENDQIEKISDHKASLCLSAYMHPDGSIDRKGIRLAEETLNSFHEICKQHQMENCWCAVTSPARTKNGQELINALKRTGFDIVPLKGVEEAACDFMGTRFSFPDITGGIAFDIGGASTRLISFHHCKVQDAAFLPLGRMAQGEDVLEQYRNSIIETRETYDTLNTPCSTMIGIGDAVEDIAHVCNVFWANTQMKHMYEIADVRKRITDQDPAVLKAIRDLVPQSRQSTFLTGYDMFMTLAGIYEADRIMISPTGIIEGFLLARLDEMK